MPGTHRGCCATTALLLCLAAAASAAAEDVIPADIGALHAEAQQRWETQRAHRYLDDIGNERRRAVVGRVCGGILDEEERWMCEKRGAHLAERMEGYQKISRADLADMIEDFNGPFRRKHSNVWGECGMWFNIVDGKLDKWGTFGHALPWKDVWQLVIGRVLEAIKFGAIEPGQTFDYVMIFGDGAAYVPQSPFSGGLPRYPVAKYSYTPTNEPHHFAMPWFEGWQLDGHLPHRPYLPFEKLKKQAITRNAQGSLPRVFLSMLSGSGFNPLLNVSMLPGKIDQRPLCRELLPRMIKALKAEHARDPTSFDLDAVLEQLSSVRDKDAPCGQLVYGNRIDWDEYVSYKYLISPDSREAPVSRFWMLMRAPGVTMPILESKKTFQEYYFRDAVPFLHYVPVTDDLDALATNITTSLQWLEQHQATAKYIGEESTRWVGRHKTHKTDMRQYKLYFALLSDMYVADPTREIQGRVDRKVECTETAEKFLFYGEKGCGSEVGTVCKKWTHIAWNLTCGPRAAQADLRPEGQAKPTWLAKVEAPNTTTTTRPCYNVILGEHSSATSYPMMVMAGVGVVLLLEKLLRRKW
eukprot:Rhum_TRINITY_DN15344_c6_g4::Rhum_TRINITY_DN15344_c6_g4_i7::g.153431::m.153431